MERLTKEREAQIRSDVASCAIDADDAAALLAEIDALRKERDALEAAALAARGELEYLGGNSDDFDRTLGVVTIVNRALGPRFVEVPRG